MLTSQTGAARRLVAVIATNDGLDRTSTSAHHGTDRTIQSKRAPDLDEISVAGVAQVWWLRALDPADRDALGGSLNG
jgi:hypothetical protein